MASSVNLSPLPNMFGDVPEDNVIFCIDTSGSMHNALPVVKLHLQETLCTMAAHKNKKFFNIIEFNSKVTAWSDKLICSTRETTALAMEWVGQLSAQTGTNTLGALQAALSSPQVDAVYLMTDSLPEQHRNDILDEIVTLSNGRPVHCICITDSVPETALTDFLEDLSIETFGSLHIVQVSTHGYVERVTPVYTADHGRGRMLLTPSGGRYNPQKSCSLTSTLLVDPEYWKAFPSLNSPNFHPLLQNYPTWPYHPFLGPNCHMYGPRAWSRFYPARSWLKDKQNEIDSSLTPGAGAILIGKKVLARRHEDGLFYLGTVQSQILLSQFLVAFGPCKHGDFMDTTYQETDVFDIIDYNEAARHSILTGDYVLAPWQPEGEKFRPGKVVHGQETRHSEPRSKDSKLTISFDNGIVANVNPNIVVWIPKEFYNRVQLELQMPLSARQHLQSEDGYPRVTKPGYPSSGPRPKPKDYCCVNPLSLRQPSFTLMNGGWMPYPTGYIPVSNVYPTMRNVEVATAGMGKLKSDIVTTSEDSQSQIIPGTNLSAKELNEKVNCQIAEHKKSMNTLERRRALAMKEKSDKAKTKGNKERSLLPYNRDKKRDREKPETTDLLEGESDFDDPEEEGDWHSSPKVSFLASDLENSPDLGFYDDFGLDDFSPPCTKDVGINTEMVSTKSKTGSQHQPPWKYWHSDPIPSLTDRSSKVGPFRETLLQVPLELRDKSQHPTQAAEWSSSAFNYVDRFSKHRHNDSVKELLKTPRPPETPPPPPPATAPPANRQRFREIQTPQHITDEGKAISRQKSRRQAVLSREAVHKQKMEEAERLQKTKDVTRREKVLKRIIDANQTFQEEQRQIQATCDAKKQINAEIRHAIGAKQDRQWQRQDQRIKAKKTLRENRDREQALKYHKEQEDDTKRKQLQFERSQRNWAQVHNRLVHEEAEANARMQRAQQAKLRQIAHFQRREKENQEKKQKKDINAEQQLALYRSRVFP